MLGFDALKLDSNLFARDNVGACKWSVIDEGGIDTRYLTKVDVTETATANLTANTILVAHTKILDPRQWSVVCFEQKYLPCWIRLNIHFNVTRLSPEQASLC